MNKQLILDYIISLVNLYGLVHKEKVAEIYNMQNTDRIKLEDLDNILKEEPQQLSDYFVEIHGDYFVSETILEFDEFEWYLAQKRNKPYYIPDKKELLKYKDEFYFEKNKEYQALLSYVTKNIFDGDKDKAQEICEDIQGICGLGFSMGTVFEEFNRRDLSFDSEDQAKEVMQLVMDLANNTRIWENNGILLTKYFIRWRNRI
ncbi:hypothetical protein [Natranaerobius thermophilus]|uniref:Uncharacterized protein n=1 Tax=Natranaerobius thermophilus (strain ATCC BAA-1301 / DSM 18059 / JW/NM-WN-LF) TaxID=457570 RepID=B2A5D5_NATTJ|nr:hypothetical protein [Natranaerobius thermophilus]ACB83969.1 conserved hypothetical protein [Natranaerobius thermophilus JW/NM-WN-LF]